jgi:GAF domain-containing protein
MHDGAGYKAFNSQQAVLMNDVDHDPVNELLDNPGSIKSLLVLPIIYRYKAFGIIYLLSFQHSPHTPHSLNLAAAIASIIGIACDNLNLLDSLNQQVQNLTDLMDIASAVQGSLKQDEILHAIVEKSYRRFSAHTCQINLVHKAENWLEIAAFKGFTPRITGRINDKKIYRYTSSCPALRGGGARVYTARNACPGFHSHGPVKSYLCAPLAVGEEIFGVIHLTSLQENAYGPDDLTFLASFAREAGMAVQRGRLYEALAMEKLKIETIIKSIDDPLVVLDGRGTMIMANTAFYYYFAINPSGNDGRDLAQLISESPYTVSIEPHDYKSLLNNVLHNTAV